MLPDRFRLAIEAAEVGFWDLDPSSRRIDLDARAATILRLSPGRRDWADVLAIVHPDDVSRVGAALDGTLGDDRPMRVEFRVVAPEGEIVWVSSRGAIRGDDRGHAQVVGVMVDVTARHAALAARELVARERSEAAALLDTLLEQAPLGIAFCDAELQFVRLNRAFAEMTRRPVDAHLGATVEAILEGAPLAAALGQALTAVRETGATLTHEIGEETLGEPRHYRVYHYPVQAHGLVVGVGTICDEVTEQKLAERHLAEAHAAESAARAAAERLNRVKDEFLSTVSHELRTPLQSILGWARTLSEGDLEPDQVELGLRTIERNAHTQARIVEDILDVSRIISGKLRIARQVVAVGPVVAAAVETMRPAALAKDLTLEATLPADLAPIVADADRLAQVLWNLLSNAVKFTAKGGTVRVVVEPREGSVELRVEDTGQGIRPSFLPHVFERFRQQDGGTTRAQGGLGLGLAIVRHIVEMHGGTVWAESEGEGRGAKFGVRLPVQPTVQIDAVEAPREEATARNSRPVARKPLEGVSVLVAEDEQDARDLLAIVLRRNGARIRAVGSAREALAALADDSFDVLVSDVGMPDLDGYALAERLRDHPRRPRALLALTAFARAEDRRAALAAGFDGHAAKPIDPAELVARIAALVV